MEREFRRTVEEAKGRGQTIFLSSHILSEVEALCDRVAILRNGRLVELGSLDQMRHLSSLLVEVTFDGPVPDLVFDPRGARRPHGGQHHPAGGRGVHRPPAQGVGPVQGAGADQPRALARRAVPLAVRGTGAGGEPRWSLTPSARPRPRARGEPSDRPGPSSSGRRPAARSDQASSGATSSASWSRRRRSATRGSTRRRPSGTRWPKAFGSNHATAALFGPAPDLQTVAGFTVFKSLMTVMVLGALWGLLTSTRLLRGEEDAGRWELLLTGQSTRRSAAAQALGGLGMGLAALWFVTAVITVLTGRISSVGFSVGASLYFSLAQVAAAVMFLAVGALTSQLAATRRQATTLGRMVPRLQLLRAHGGRRRRGAPWAHLGLAARMGRRTPAAHVAEPGRAPAGRRLHRGHRCSGASLLGPPRRGRQHAAATAPTPGRVCGSSRVSGP